MKNIKNLKEFKKLILKYENITEEDIKKATLEVEQNVKNKDQHPNMVARKLTGFGYGETCSLCQKAKDCKYCVYAIDEMNMNIVDCGCMKGLNKTTFSKITYANTSMELLKAFRLRAERMRKILKDNKIDFDKI